MRSLAAGACLLGLIASAPMPAQSNPELAQFYESELRKFVVEFRPHVRQAELCIAEMDTFETENVFIEPVECPKFDEMVSRAKFLVENIMPVVASLQEQYAALSKSGASPDPYEAAHIQLVETNGLLSIYNVRHEQLIKQSARVQALEQELMLKLEGLSRAMRELSESSPEEPNQ